MTKYNDSMISLLDAVDKIFDTLWSNDCMYPISTHYSIGPKEFAPVKKIGDIIEASDKLFQSTSLGYYNPDTTWYEWTSIPMNIPKIDVPNYPVSSGYIKEDGTMYLSFAVTGFDKSEISVKAEDTTLIVTGKLKEKTDTSKWKQLFNSIAIRDFEWKRRISNKYDLEMLFAKMDNGILKIFIPLKEACKPVKKEFEIK